MPLLSPADMAVALAQTRTALMQLLCTVSQHVGQHQQLQQPALMSLLRSAYSQASLPLERLQQAVPQVCGDLAARVSA